MMKVDPIWIVVFIMVILALVVIFDYYYIDKLKKRNRDLKEASKELVEAGLEAVNLNKSLLKDIDEQNKIIKLNKNIKTQMNKVLESKVAIDKGTFEITAYDLSVESCGKKPGDKGYGITANQTSLVGKSKDFNSIAVDPDVIPMNSFVYVDFIDKEDIVYNGVYKANDTGGAVKGKIIDIFLGDFNSTKEHESVPKFGRKKANVYILK